MEYLLHKIPVTTNIIGVRIRFSNGSLTAAVDRLEHQGAVERRGHPADCRASIVHLDGVAAVERVLAIGLLRKLGLTAQWLLHDPDKNRALSCNE
jgi:DNA-binding MarR family transcriptional regulator